MITSKLVLTALEIRKIGQRQEIAIVYVLLDGSSTAKISTCIFYCFNYSNSQANVKIFLINDFYQCRSLMNEKKPLNLFIENVLKKLF